MWVWGQDAWNELRARVPPGAEAQLLDAPADRAGADRGTLKLQKAITECLEEINFKALDDRVKQLPLDDERHEASRGVVAARSARTMMPMLMVITAPSRSSPVARAPRRRPEGAGA